MNQRIKIVILMSMVITALLFCYLALEIQGELKEKLNNAVAQTVTAKMANTEQPQSTDTLAPTDTGTGTPAKTPPPCNAAQVVSQGMDDDTEFLPNTPFTMTWRLKNVGTCTWTTDYALAYASGDKMGDPTAKHLPNLVAPGEQIDLQVDLTAPASEGTYQGYWEITDENGQTCANNLSVKIKVKPGTLNTYTVTLDAKDAEGGTIWSNGDVYRGDYSVGDAVGNFGVQSFAAFDISSIPSNAVINQVTVDFTNSLTLGDPFGGLGCLRLYPDLYRLLSPDDYKTGALKGAHARWCSSGELGTAAAQIPVAEYLQTQLGDQYLTVRLQFNDLETDGDDANDMLGFFILSLIVTYQAP